jgi:hypothetical protein
VWAWVRVVALLDWRRYLKQIDRQTVRQTDSSRGTMRGPQGASSREQILARKGNLVLNQRRQDP